VLEFIQVFMYFFGAMSIFSAISIYFFKSEESKANILEAEQSGIIQEEDDSKFSLIKSYQIIWKLLRVKAVRELGFIILTCKVTFFL
jgi:hypothetical protein